MFKHVVKIIVPMILGVGVAFDFHFDNIKSVSALIRKFDSSSFIVSYLSRGAYHQELRIPWFFGLKY